MSIRLSPVLAASMFTLAPLVAGAQPLTFERSLTVGAAPSLDAAADSGNVTVRAGSGSTIVVKGTVEVRKGWNVPSNAADLAKQVAATPPITQTGDAVKVGRIVDETTRKAVSVSYDISVPAATMVAASSGSGNVAVSGVNNSVKANSGSGNIDVSGIGGDVDARTGSGNVTVKDAKKAANLSSGSGNIVGMLTGQGDVKASTGSGDIKLTGVVGLLSANTGSGSIGVEGKPTGDWKLSAASGDVQVAVPSEQGFTLDASTASGSLDIAAPLTVQGKIDRRRVQGTVRGGGPTLRLSTASGDIAVR
jgi:DUF4097 and DUF4098 domain-containing protein YvlB